MSSLADQLEALPARCAEARAYRALTFRAAAEEIGITQSALWQFEHGRNTGLRTLVAIARWVDTDPDLGLAEAARILVHAAGRIMGAVTIGEVADVAEELWREAARAYDPEAGGDAELFARVTHARDLLVAFRARPAEERVG